VKVYQSIQEFPSDINTIITIGTFDGVHVGHQKVLKDLVESAKKNNASSVLLTFFPHPRMVLQKESNIKLINTIDERIQLLHKIGLNSLVIHEFSNEFSNLTAIEFVKKILVNKLKIAKLIIGYDHHFGKNREGNFEKLQELGKIFDFKLKKISQHDISDIAVSSTKIRKAIENGEIEKANTYLGYNFMLTGEVVMGKNLGEKIGFPTANVSIKETYKLIPKTGVYLVKSKIENETFFGMMNIGFRPTVSGKNQTIEINYFNFSKNLYGKILQVEVLKYMRNEIKFESVEALKIQLHKDKENALKTINGTFFESD